MMRKQQIKRLLILTNFATIILVILLTGKLFWLHPHLLPNAYKRLDISDVVWQREIPIVMPLLHVGNDDERVYFESVRTGESQLLGSPNSLHCVDTKTGRLFWSLPLPFDAVTSICGTGSKGIVFVSTQNGIIFAVRSTDGKTIWTSHRMLGSTPASATFHQDRLFVSTMNGGLWCFQSLDGRVLWHTSLGQSQVERPVVTDSAVFSAIDGNIFKLDLIEGTIQWVFRSQTEFSGEMTTGENGQLYASIPDFGLLALRQSDGHILWHRAIYNATKPIVSRDKVFVAGDIDGETYLACLNHNSGLDLWHIKGNHYSISSPAILNDKLFVSWDDKLKVISREGIIKQTYNLSGYLSTPWVSNSYIHVASIQGSSKSFITVFNAGKP